MNITRQLKKAYWFQKHFGFKKLIYSAGMPRSGSTLLFNILKLILDSKYKERLSYGWKDDVDTIKKGDVYLIKTHGLTKMDIYRAAHTFYTFRDIRDVLVSRYRMFIKEPDIDIVRYYVSQDIFAKRKASLVLKYEDMILDQGNVIKHISDILKIPVIPDDILSKLPDPKNKNGPDGYHSPDTLLHKNHVTGTARGEWKNILSESLTDQISDEFGWWFKENEYEF